MTHTHRAKLIFAGLALAIWLSLAAPAFAADRPPNLTMQRPTDVSLDTTSQPGHTLLLYTARLANTGTGALEVRGDRPDTLSPMTVSQRVYNDIGGFRDVPLPNATMAYETADGHNHWHLHDLELGELLDASGRTVAALAKHGFCFNDTQRLKGRTPFRYDLAGCQGFDPDALRVTMGVSAGWEDIYSAGIALQYIDVTGLPAGTYRLRITANPALGLVESSVTDNSSSVSVRL